jgi:basic membrane lipoprotein Med (substrate-binding protein (PBP1-ABC) superfamily)
MGLLLLLTALCACGGESEDKYSVALVYNQFGRVDDGSFCQSAYEGGMEAVRDFGIHLDYTPPQSQANYDKQIEEFIEQDFDFIISVGFHLMDATLAKALEHPEVPFAIIDVAYEEYPPNLAAVVFREDQCGYLAGVLASQMTTSEKLGCIGGMEIPPVKRYCSGYKQGVASHCPDCDTEVVYVGSFDDENAGQYNAQLMMDAERDVIFGAGGSMGSAAISFAAKNDTWVIGVDTDEYRTTFMNGE